MAVKTRARTMPDTYFELVKRFPLTRIRDDHHLAAAQKLIDELLQQNLDKGEQAYLDVLTDLVEIYEDEHHPIPDASEADVLRELMAANRLTQQQLGKQVKISQSTISAILNGHRSLTREQMTTLAKFFHISSAVFLPA
jgi:HTH-type transcriptional regulator / antitoxin HigA